jgi:hypothetical protein
MRPPPPCLHPFVIKDAAVAKGGVVCVPEAWKGPRFQMDEQMKFPLKMKISIEGECVSSPTWYIAAAFGISYMFDIIRPVTGGILRRWPTDDANATP